MNTLKIIEEQKKQFNSKFVAHITSEKGNIEHDRAVIFFEDTVKIYDWHKQSIIQILESEIERKNKDIEDTEKWLRGEYADGVIETQREDIAHLTNLIDSLK